MIGTSCRVALSYAHFHFILFNFFLRFHFKLRNTFDSMSFIFRSFSRFDFLNYNIVKYSKKKKKVNMSKMYC